jgi:hypothetical protein
MKKLIALVCLTAAMAVGLATPASAAPPTPVTITAAESLPVGLPGTFTATGFCPSGSVATSGALTSIPPGSVARFTVIKTFTCADGSGTLLVRLRVALDTATGETTGRWKVVGGTDDWAGTKGHGSLDGVPFPGGITDYYDGSLK